VTLAAVRTRTPIGSELDQVTLARAQRGEEGACRALVERYQGPVFALLSRMLGGARRELREDLAQETFLRVFRALAGFSHAGSARLSTWILTIATRLALDELRRRPPATEPLELATRAAAPGRTDEQAERRALGAALQRAVAALTPEQRAVFLLREYHDLEYDELARVLDVDVGTVKSRLSRARAALREALAEVADG
jgi:RNA polymerase sigma-70 factor (ECF subfamily)